MDTKALFTQRFDAARAALAEGNEPAAAESLHWAIVAARTDPNLRRELASALFHLGKLSRKFGKAGEAEAAGLLTEALAISEELFGTENAALGPVLNELSRLYLQQSQHQRAAEVLERLLVIARVKGDEHADVAAALAGLAFVKRKLGDDASAEALYREALHIRERVLEPDHTVTVGTLEQLSETCAARGNLAEALALLHRALPAREAALGANHERVRTMRTRVSKLELEIAIAADTAAAAAAKAARAATPTPVWLKRVPDTPADSATTAAPSPITTKELEFLGEAEPQVLRPARSRDRSKTPAVAAAVAAASLMVSSIPTPSASQMAIPASESARASGSFTGLEAGVTHRDGVLADVVLAAVANNDVASADVAIEDPRSNFAAGQGYSPAPARKNKTVLYASAATAAVVIAVAGLLMSRPRAVSGKDPVPAETTAAPRSSNGGDAPVAPAGATPTVAAVGAAAVVGAKHADSLHTASASTHAASAVKPEQHAPEPAAPEISAPTVDIHVAPIAVPTMNAGLNADSILRSAPEKRPSDTGRTAVADRVTQPMPDLDAARTPPKLIGRVPEPRFPELLRSVRREGQVVVRFMVNERGTIDVSSMVVERSDHELFTAAVREILPQFRFEPARTRAPDSKPVAAWMTVPFRFATKK